MMLRIWSRVGVFLATGLVGSILVFLLLAVLPGNPAAVALGTGATPQALAQMERSMGLNNPLWERYLDWMGGVLSGNLGTSQLTGVPIGGEIAQRLEVTGTLIVLGMLIALVVAIPLGVLAALNHRKNFGTLLSALSQVGVAVPSFITAIVLIDVFAVKLGVLSSGGWVWPSQGFVPFLKSAVMPVLSIGLVQGALLSRYIRSAALDVMNEDYIRTARAKGLSVWRTFLRHGARNSAIPVITVLGMQVAALFIDTIIVERVFVIPGLGSLLFDSVTSRDLIVVQDVVLLLVVAILLINLLVDIVYTMVDPRLKGTAA